MIYVDPVRTVEGSMPMAEELWSFIDGLNPFTADVALAVLAQLCEPSVGRRPKHPLVESVRVSGDAILAYRGIRRWGEERGELRARISREMERLGKLSFDIRRYPARYAKGDSKPGRWNDNGLSGGLSGGISTKGDRMFDIVAVEQYEETRTGRKPMEPAWLVRAGHWAYWWMNAQARVWVGRTARALLGLDHRTNQGAAAIARKIARRTTLLGGSLRGHDVVHRRIDRLLADIGELPAPEARDQNWADGVRGPLEEAMSALAEAGVLAAVDWPDGYGPDDHDRPEGWVGRWLAAKVFITLPHRPLALSPRVPAWIKAGRKIANGHRPGIIGFGERHCVRGIRITARPGMSG